MDTDAIIIRDGRLQVTMLTFANLRIAFVSSSTGECGVSGRAQYERAGGVWVDTRRPAAQLSLDIQPLAPCTTYVEAGIYLHVNHFLEAATPETCVPATVARSRVTGANYLLVSASHRQQPRVRAPPLTGAGTGTAQQEFLCQYQAVGTGDYIDLRVR